MDCVLERLEFPCVHRGYTIHSLDSEGRGKGQHNEECKSDYLETSGRPSTTTQFCLPNTIKAPLGSCILVLDLDKTCIYFDEENKLFTPLPRYYVRPGVEIFLRIFRQTFNLKNGLCILWSAGQRGYVNDALLQTGLGSYFDIVWDYTTCQKSERRTGYAKHYEYMMCHPKVRKWLIKALDLSTTICPDNVATNVIQWNCTAIQKLTLVTTIIVDDLLEANIGDSPYTYKFRCPQFDSSILFNWLHCTTKSYGSTSSSTGERCVRKTAASRETVLSNHCTVQPWEKIVECLSYFEDEILLTLSMELFHKIE
jgi:NLI interacting factor-like phosphatase